MIDWGHIRKTHGGRVFGESAITSFVYVLGVTQSCFSNKANALALSYRERLINTCYTVSVYRDPSNGVNWNQTSIQASIHLKQNIGVLIENENSLEIIVICSILILIFRTPGNGCGIGFQDVWKSAWLFDTKSDTIEIKPSYMRPPPQGSFIHTENSKLCSLQINVPHISRRENFSVCILYYTSKSYR